MDWNLLGITASVIAAIATVGLVILTFFYVIATRDIVTEMKAEREDRARPNIVVDVEFSRGWLMYIVLKNTGYGAAYDVICSFAPELQNSRGDKLSELKMFSEPLPFLPPGKEIRHLFDSAVQFYAEGSAFVKKSTVTLAYRNGFGRKSEEKQVLDMSIYGGLHFRPEYDLTNLVEEIRHLRNILESMTDGLAPRALVITTPSGVRRKHQEEMELYDRMRKEDKKRQEVAERVRKAFGSRPDLPPGEEYVEKIRKVWAGLLKRGGNG